MPIITRKRENPIEKEVVFKVGRRGIASELYGSLKHDRKEIDKLIKTEKWNL